MAQVRQRIATNDVRGSATKGGCRRRRRYLPFDRNHSGLHTMLRHEPHREQTISDRELGIAAMLLLVVVVLTVVIVPALI
jgi:hypothetical protein